MSGKITLEKYIADNYGKGTMSRQEIRLMLKVKKGLAGGYVAEETHDHMMRIIWDRIDGMCSDKKKLKHKPDAPPESSEERWAVIMKHREEGGISGSE